MAGIIVPKIFRTKPPPTNGINLSHPLVHGLKYFFGFNELGGLFAHNSVAEKRHNISMGNGFWDANGLNFRNSSPTTGTWITIDQFLTISEVTWIFRANHTNWATASYQRLAEKGTPGPWEISHHAGNEAFYIHITPIGGSLVSTELINDVSATNNKLYDFAARLSGSDIRTWLNGEEWNFNTIGTGGLSNIVDNWYIGRYPGDTTQNWDGKIEYFAIWARALSVNEIRQFIENPYQIYRQPRILMVVSPPAAGQTISLSSIVSEEQTGKSQFNLGLHSSGISSEEQMGKSQLNLRLKSLGIPSEEQLGKSQFVLRPQLSGIISEEGLGKVTVNRAINLGGISSEEQVGKPAFVRTYILFGIPTEEKVGKLTFAIGQIISLKGITSEEKVGKFSYSITLRATGIISEESLGRVTIKELLKLSGLTSEEQIGKLTLGRIIHPAGILTEEQLGRLTLSYLRILRAGGIPSEEKLGLVTIIHGGAFSRILWSSIEAIKSELTSREVKKAKVTGASVQGGD